MLRGQGPGAWPVCSRRAGLTTANGLAASSGSSTSSRSTSRVSLTSGRLTEDGQLGARTKAAIEEWIGAPTDGRLGTKWDIHRLQREVGVPQSERNGWMHKRSFVLKLQKRFGATQNGVWGQELTREMQEYLNWKLARR